MKKTPQDIINETKSIDNKEINSLFKLHPEQIQLNQLKIYFFITGRRRVLTPHLHLAASSSHNEQVQCYTN